MVDEAVGVGVCVSVGVLVAEAVAVAVDVAVVVLVDVAVGHAAPDEQSVPDPGGVMNEQPKSRLPVLQAVGILLLKAQKDAQSAKSVLSVLPEFEPVQQQAHSAALAMPGATAATHRLRAPLPQRSTYADYLSPCTARQVGRDTVAVLSRRTPRVKDQSSAERLSRPPGSARR